METSTVPASQEAFWTPAWVQDAIFYQIFPDRFARSLAVPKPSNLEPWDSPPTLQGFKGGDLLGVADRLDYLADLGINAIYFCPIFRSTANHRYHTHDYYEVDPILGGDAALDTLLKEAHARGIRIVLDGVFNHCGRGFYQFNSILENGPNSPYIDWFTIHSWPLHPYGPPEAPAGYAAWWNDRALPEFNTQNPEVREFLWRVGEYWIERGIDGWRLDVPNEIDDDDFWREFRRRVKRANPDAYIVGEIWGDAQRWLAGDQFDAAMNYLFTKACLGFVTRVRGIDDAVIAGTGLFPIETLSAEQFAGFLDSIVTRYPWPATATQLNLIDSHDTARFLTVARGDETALRLAVLLQMTVPGAPCIYYGDEIGMTGGHDPASRGAFPWDHTLWNDDLRSYVRRCVAVRREHASLRHGTFTSLKAENDVYAFMRRTGEAVAIVAINTATETRRLDIDLPQDARVSNAQPALGDELPEITDGKIRSWNLPARSGAILTAQVAPPAT